jgi:hypothetical protein
VFAAGAALVTLSGCASSFDAWAVTYEVSVTDTTDGNLTDIAYAEEERRNGPSKKTEQDSVESGGSPSTWSQEVIVSATQWAYVTATPAPDGIATCRILLDGDREIDTQTAEVGQPVTCSVPTPTFG